MKDFIKIYLHKEGYKKAPAIINTSNIILIEPIEEHELFNITLSNGSIICCSENYQAFLHRILEQGDPILD